MTMSFYSLTIGRPSAQLIIFVAEHFKIMGYSIEMNVIFKALVKTNGLRVFKKNVIHF